MAKYNNFNEMTLGKQQFMIGKVKRLYDRDYSIAEIMYMLDMSEDCVREILKIIYEAEAKRLVSAN